MSITIGSYVAGERPEPLEYQFLDAVGRAINLTGYTATFRFEIGGTGTENPATVSTPKRGKVTYAWEAGDLTEGMLSAEFEVSNGTNTFISERLTGSVGAAIEVP